MRSTSARIAIRESGFSSRLPWFHLFKLLLTFSIFTWLIYYLRSHDLFVVFQRVRPAAIFWACGLLPLNLGLQFLKWHYLLRCATRALTPRASLFSLLAGFPLGLITPGRWGELGRAFFLPQVNRHQVMLLAAVDKVFDLLINLLFGAIALICLIKSAFLPQAMLQPAVILLFGFIALNALALQPHVLKSLAHTLKQTHTKKFPSLRVLTRLSAKNLAVVWLISFLFVLTYSLQFVILLRGFVDVSLYAGSIGAAATFFAKSLLPIAIGDLGVREGAAAFFFARMNLSPQAAFDASLLLFAINLLAPSLLGMWLVWKYRPARPAQLGKFYHHKQRA